MTDSLNDTQENIHNAVQLASAGGYTTEEILDMLTAINVPTTEK